MKFYSFKNHVKIDQGANLIGNYVVTPESMHDSQALDDLINAGDGGQVL